MPKSFKPVLEYLIASLAYHSTWLRNNLDASHPLFQTYLFTSGYVNELKDNVILGYGSCESTGMKASGLPPTISLMIEMTNLLKKMSEVSSSVVNAQEQIGAKIQGME